MSPESSAAAVQRSLGSLEFLLFSTALAYTPCHSESDIDVDLILFFVFVFDSAAETWLFCLGYALSPNFRRSFCTKESFNCT